MPLVASEIESLYRAGAARVLATLIRLLRDFDLAEEVAQEAFAAALEQWPANGVPTNPHAWLVGVGHKKGIDRIRRRVRHREKVHAMGAEVSEEDASYEIEDAPEVEDDRLRLIFTCCHHALLLDA